MDEPTLYVTFTGPIEDPSVAQLIQLLENIISKDSIKHLYLALSTPGGGVNAGIVLYHYLRGLSINVTTHNIGQVDSIGNMVFLGGEERVASQATSFLLHGVSMRVNGPRQLSKEQLNELQGQIKQDEARIEAITTQRTTLTKAKLAKFFRSGDSLSPQNAKNFGIVTDIRELKIPGDAKKIVVNTFPVPNKRNVPNN